MNKQELLDKISQIRDKLIDIEEASNKRIYLSLEPENIVETCRFLFEEVPCRFVIVTGIDSDDCFEMLYHFAYDKTGHFVTAKAFVRDRENPSVESITPFILGAEWIEREIHDILGIEFRNHPNMKRLILADDWPEGVYPMRKDAKNVRLKEASK